MPLEESKSPSSQSLNASNFLIKIVFLVGQPVRDFTDELQSRINYENELYGDIIQENFRDSYNNLTLKSILMLKWVKNNCLDKGKLTD